MWLVALSLVASPARAEDWHVGDVIDPAAIADVTPEGFDAIALLIPSLLPSSIDIPATSASSDNGFCLIDYAFGLDGGAVGITVTSADITPGNGVLDITANLLVQVNSATDPFDQLEALGRAYVRFGFASPMYYRVMFMQRCDVWEKLSDSEMHDKLGSYQVLVATLRRCIDTGRTRSTDAEALSCTLWAHMHGIVSLGLTMPFLEAKDVEQMIDHSSDMMRHGILKH